MPEHRVGRLRGGFCVSWPDPSLPSGRRRYQLKATTLREAKAEARSVVAQITIPDRTLTVADVWESYRKDREGRPVAKTMGYFKVLIEYFGALECESITTEDCRGYTALRRKQGKSDGTIWTELGLLRTVLVWAAKPSRRLIAFAVDIERPQKPDPVDRWLTQAEIERLIAAAEQPHTRLAIILLLATACRVGALLELTWDRADPAGRTIDLRLDAGRPRKGRAVVPMNRMARAALLGAREAALSNHVIEWAGEPVKCIRKGFMSAVEVSGLDGVTLHVLRHTAAVHMAAAGIDMERIAAMLGHTNVATTRRIYARFAPEHLADAAEVLEFMPLRAVQ